MADDCRSLNVCKDLEHLDLERNRAVPKKSEDALDTLWLEAFLAVFDHHTHEAAAKFLGCSQSTVTNRIGKLEDWLGSSLFRKESKVTYPNNLAISFRDTAAEVLEKLKKFRREKNAFNGDDCREEATGSEEVEIEELGEPVKWWHRTFGEVEK